MTLFERVFNGNDAVYGLTEQAIDAAIAQHGEEKAVSFPNTAYCLPCYYAVTGVKVTNLKELKEALGVVKTLMTREPRLNDAFMSGVATALCAEFIEALKYIDYDLDLKVFPDGNYRILDQEEYRQHAREMGYSDELDKILKKQLDVLIDLAVKKGGPFDQNFTKKWYGFYQDLKEGYYGKSDYYK